MSTEKRGNIDPDATARAWFTNRYGEDSTEHPSKSAAEAAETVADVVRNPEKAPVQKLDANKAAFPVDPDISKAREMRNTPSMTAERVFPNRIIGK